MEAAAAGLGDQISIGERLYEFSSALEEGRSSLTCGGPSPDETPVVMKFIPPPDPAAEAADRAELVDEPDKELAAEAESAVGEGGRRELQENDCEDQLGYAFSSRKKWWILTVIFLVQTSMNFNTSLYSNGIPGIAKEFHVSEQHARLGAALFLVTYAFGCELWAPWSEEFGRKLILQLSLSLTNLWAIPVGLAPNFATILVGRSLGGLSTAGGSVTLGMIADLYDSDDQQYAIAYVVFSSVGGSILGPIIGGFVEILPSSQAWRWCTWIQLIFGVAVQALHFFTVPETRSTIIMDRIAKRRREAGEDANIYGPSEMHPFSERFSFRELMGTWIRAFKMLFTEPIVFLLSLLSGLSDAIVFVQIQSLALVYKQWDFNSWQIGLAFIPIAIGYFIAWATFIPTFKRGRLLREQNLYDDHAQFESRLYPLLWSAPCLPFGLLIFAWTSVGPPTHWIGTMFGTTLVGIANYSIYMATIDYMICAYGPYSASATGGNGLARDILAGALTPAAIPFYTSISGGSLQWASTILAGASALVVGFVWYVYKKGPTLRLNSPFAQRLSSREGESGDRQIGAPPRFAGVIAAEPVTEPAPAAQSTQPIQARIQRRDEPIAAAGPYVPGAASLPVNCRKVLKGRDRRGNKLPGEPLFGSATLRGSYMASVNASYRRRNRQLNTDVYGRYSGDGLDGDPLTRPFKPGGPGNSPIAGRPNY